jgi:hypothetical protein
MALCEETGIATIGTMNGQFLEKESILKGQ